jgi:hypothetical protein
MLYQPYQSQNGTRAFLVYNQRQKIYFETNFQNDQVTQLLAYAFFFTERAHLVSQLIT